MEYRKYIRRITLAPLSNWWHVVVPLSSIGMIYISFIVPGFWMPATGMLGIVAYVYLDTFVLLPRRRD